MFVPGTLNTVGQGFALYGDPYDVQTHHVRRVVGTIMTELAEIVPIAWDDKTQRYEDARFYPQFIEMQFDLPNDEEDDDEPEEIEEATLE